MLSQAGRPVVVFRKSRCSNFDRIEVSALSDREGAEVRMNRSKGDHLPFYVEYSPVWEKLFSRRNPLQ